MTAPSKRAGAEAYSLHGLRYNAASELFEAGCSNARVQAITGHRTREMVAKYDKGASQRRLAREARNLQKRQRERNRKVWSGRSLAETSGSNTSLR